MLRRSVVHLGGYSYCIFPWLGTRSFRTLRKYIALNAKEFKISNVEFEGCYFISMKMECDEREFVWRLAESARDFGIDCDALVGGTEMPVFEKYDEYIPGELLRRAYSADRLRADEAERRLQEIANEFQ